MDGALGPVQHVSIFVSLRIRPPSARIRWKGSPKTQLSENAPRSGNFWSAVFVFPREWWKPEVFVNDDVSRLDPVYPRGRNHEGIWWFYVSALHKAARKYARMPKARAKLLYYLFLLKIDTAQQTEQVNVSVSAVLHSMVTFKTGKGVWFSRTYSNSAHKSKR